MQYNNHRSLSIDKLTLHNFRNHQNLSIDVNSKAIIIYGKNGSGKTNILEAISLLSPGKGLRNAKLDEFDHKNSQDSISKPWHIEAKIKGEYGTSDILTYKLHNNETGNSKRIIKIDDQLIKNHADLIKLLSIIWLVPQMDYLFASGSSERRKFFDRLVYNFFPEHADHLSIYEKSMKERAKLLKEQKFDLIWLSALEQNMAEKACTIAASRMQVLEYLQNSISSINSHFPKAILSIKGQIEQEIHSKKAVEIEESFKQQLKDSRKLDSISGRTNAGIHRSDLLVYHQEKNIEASLCSTGEQKALLISIILAKARARIKLFSSVPILLLDEITAHLDDKRIESLFEELTDLSAQIWLTGTKEANFSQLNNKAQLIELSTIS